MSPAYPRIADRRADKRPTVLAYGTPPGVGGLGHHAADVLEAMQRSIGGLKIYGPPPADQESAGHVLPPFPFVPAWRRRYTWLRYMTGQYQYATDRRFGRWLASQVPREGFGRAYVFAQIAHECLRLAKGTGALTVLDNPNGHIRDFREQLCRESLRWTGWPFLGHPSERMVRRVEEEYRLADGIRVSSHWARRSLIARGVDADKIFVVPQAIDINRFRPCRQTVARGPLRLVFVGSISLGKGFPYLLRALSLVGARHFHLEMIGATGDPWCRRLLKRLRAGLDVVDGPGDPLPAYQQGDLFVLPSLHDGFGLVVAEAMACGLPVITTDACGASEWVTEESGWVLPRGQEEALAAALESALTRRDALPAMGMAARRTAESLTESAMQRTLLNRLSEQWNPRGDMACTGTS